MDLSKEDIAAIAASNLFKDISTEEITKLIDCMKARIKKYKKDELIIEEGSLVYDFGIILKGNARTIKWDEFTDKIFIVNISSVGASIAVMCAASLEHISPVSVIADSEVSVIYFSFEKLFNHCDKACPCHSKLLRNYVNAVAENAVYLYGRINCLIQPSIRQKVLNYLKNASKGKNRSIFSIPVNRNHMAEYLNVDRSALSRELSAMKKCGLIDYHKDSFKLLL